MTTVRCVVCVLVALAWATRAGASVTNGDFSAGNTGFTSTASYVASGPLSYNQYAVRTTASSANGSWCGTDHTGGGNMLLVDSALGTVWGQTVSLAPGNYVFSVYVMNVLCSYNNPLTQPNLELRINGATVAGPMNIPQVSSTWVLMSASFTVTVAGPVALAVWSNQNAINGADFALDDITVQGVVGVEHSTWGKVKALFR